MKMQIDISEAIGRRIAAVKFDQDDGVLIVFDDGTFSLIAAHSEYEGVGIADRELDLREVCHYAGPMLIELGIATKEEIEAAKR